MNMATTMLQDPNMQNMKYMNNPALMNMATTMLQDPNMQNM